MPSSNGKFFSIISVYEGKCSDDGLFNQKCNKNNKYKDFTIRNNAICSRIDKKKKKKIKIKDS